MYFNCIVLGSIPDRKLHRIFRVVSTSEATEMCFGLGNTLMLVDLRFFITRHYKEKLLRKHLLKFVLVVHKQNIEMCRK